MPSGSHEDGERPRTEGYVPGPEEIRCRRAEDGLGQEGPEDRRPGRVPGRIRAGQEQEAAAHVPGRGPHRLRDGGVRPVPARGGVRGGDSRDRTRHEAGVHRHTALGNGLLQARAHGPRAQDGAEGRRVCRRRDRHRERPLRVPTAHRTFVSTTVPKSSSLRILDATMSTQPSSHSSTTSRPIRHWDMHDSNPSNT